MAFNFGQPQAAPAFGGFGGFGAAPSAAPAAPAFGGFGAAAPAFGAPAAAPPADGDIQVQLPPGSDSISTLNWSPDSRFLSAGAWDNKVLVFVVNRGANNSATGAAYQGQTPDVGAPVLDHCWSPDGSTVYIVGCNKTIKAWSLASPQGPLVDIGQHDGPIKSVHWVPSANLLVTGGWDRTIRYWDPRSKTQAGKVDLPERLFSMDLRGNTLVAACGGQEKKIAIFNVAGNPMMPVRVLDSPLKFQTRAVKVFHDQRFFAISSIEGRCAIRCVNEADDNMKEPGNPAKTKYSFAFKCHRDDKYIYSVNALDCHPQPQYHQVFATAASDGIFTYWDKDKKQRLKEFNRGIKTPIVDCKWNPTGELFAYAHSYDWSKGAEFYDQKTMPPQIFLHNVTIQGELMRPATAGR